MKEVIELDSLVKSLEGIFKRLPPLPAGAVDTLFKIAPWIALIFGILGVLGALGALGLLAVFAPFAALGGVRNWGLGFISAIGLGIASLLMIVAFPGLKAGKMAGWNMLFASELVSIVSSIVGFSVGTIIGAVIGLYLLFAIKPKYK